MRIKALQENRILLVPETIARKYVKNCGRNIFSGFAMKCRTFDLRIKADRSACGPVQPENQFNFFRKSMYAESRSI